MDKNAATLQPKKAQIVEVSNIFSWNSLLTLVLNLKKKLPAPWDECIPVNSVQDLKTTVLLVIILTTIFVMAGMYDAIMKGGVL